MRRFHDRRRHDLPSGAHARRDADLFFSELVGDRPRRARATESLAPTLEPPVLEDEAQEYEAYEAYEADADETPAPTSLPPVPVPPPVATTRYFRLLVDADRDGNVDTTDPPTTWTWGSSGRGAVVLANFDNDPSGSDVDTSDRRIDTGDDAQKDIAPLVIEPVTGGPPVPPGTRLELVTSPAGVLRIFDGTAAGANEIVGPTAGARHRFTVLPTAPLRLGMEARRYAGRGFDGIVEITLRTTPPTGAPLEQRTCVRVSPWIMPNHTHTAEKVFVVDAGGSNLRFRTDLRRLVTAAGCTLVEHSEPRDIWMQDALEFGVSNLPGGGFRTVFRAPRDRPLKTFARTLLAPQLGFTSQGTLLDYTTFDSHGNLEASPAVTVNGKRYRFGRIYYGPGRPHEKLDARVREFLHAQVVQAPFEIDTSWLAVGHVDEAVSFVPTRATSGNRFKLLIASPQRAYAILDALARTNPTARMFVGRSLDGGATSLETDVRTFLAANEDIHPLMRDLIARGHVRHRVRTLRVFNDERQVKLDGIRATMTRELGLSASDIIHIPAIFMPTPDAPSLTDALTPGMVNMLVVNRHCIVPKPFGPIVGTVDKFEEDVLTSLRPLGLTVNFLDCWAEYHVKLGEVHCGTNTLRNPNHGRWWLFQP